MASGWDTASNVISDAGLELGLLSEAVADPYSSSNAAVTQLCALLKGLGQDLVREYDWSHLQKTHTFSTVNGTAAYDLPSDYARTLDQTHWNRLSQLPLLGPAGAAGWQFLKAYNNTLAVNQVFRVFNDQINIHPTPSSTETVAFEYVSRWWVKESGQSAPNTETPDAANDTLHFDRRLLVAGLKLYFLRAKKMDRQDEQTAYDDTLAAAKGGDGAAPVLNLSRRPMGVVRFLDEQNLPDTGFGS